MDRRNFILCIVLVPTAATAHSYKLGTIALGHAWALPSRQVDGQLFLPLVNNGATPEALIAARSEICAVIELRTNNRYDDPAAEKFLLAPSRPFPMRPAANHLRLIGLRKPLVAGDRFSLILDFETAGEIELQVHVEPKPGS